MERSFGQLFFRAAQNRWPKLTSTQFEAATMELIKKVKSTKEATVPLLAAEFEMILIARYGQGQPSRK